MQQLELDLRFPAGNPTPIEPWKYRFTKNALIEEFGDTRIVYGSWDRLFGCWVGDIRSKASREVVPTWTPLKANGVWRDQRDVRWDVGDRRTLSSRWRYEANAAFAGLFSGIPQRIRSVVGSLGHYQWLALDLIWQHPPFARFLDEEIFNDTQQFVFACFALANADELSRRGRREFVSDLMTRKRTDVLSDLTGVTCTRATIRAITKLGEEPCDRGVYQAIAECMADSGAAKTLHHLDTIHPTSVKTLSKLPREFLLPNVARTILAEAVTEEQSDWVSAASGCGSMRVLSDLFRCFPGSVQNRVIDSLGKVQDFHSLAAWQAKWEKRLMEVVHFPPAPIECPDAFFPLGDAVAMRDEALEMQNCLDSMIASVLANQAYFFHWNGDEPATVMLENDPDEGWRFADALGFDNEPLDDPTRADIQSLVENQLGIGTAIPANWNVPRTRFR